MSAKNNQLNCGNCRFWLKSLELEAVRSTAIELNDGKKGSQPVAAQAGVCRLHPPTPYPVPQQTALGQVQMRIERISVPMLETEFCGDHSERQPEEIRRAIHFGIALWRNWLEYAPGKNPDETAAGFNRMPSFQEAKLRYSVDDKAPVQGDGGSK